MEKKPQRLRLSIPLLGLALFGLNTASDAAEVAKKTGDAEPEYFQAQNEHAEMHRAVITARKTVRLFVTALQHPTPGKTDFQVKKPFIQGTHVEHIWLSDVQWDGHRFQGRVDNRPHDIQGLKVGQLVSVNPNEISDWMYVDNGNLVGGYTIRVHYNELSPEQKQEFDRKADFRIPKQ
jgi:uncharacterized protein YegJ (DUF2314 family)